MKLGWPSRVVPDWGRGPGLLLPHSQDELAINVGLPRWGAYNLEQGSPPHGQDQFIGNVGDTPDSWEVLKLKSGEIQTAWSVWDLSVQCLESKYDRHWYLKWWTAKMILPIQKVATVWGCAAGTEESIRDYIVMSFSAKTCSRFASAKIYKTYNCCD